MAHQGFDRPEMFFYVILLLLNFIDSILLCKEKNNEFYDLIVEISVKLFKNELPFFIDKNLRGLWVKFKISLQILKSYNFQDQVCGKKSLLQDKIQEHLKISYYFFLTKIKIFPSIAKNITTNILHILEQDLKFTSIDYIILIKNRNNIL